MAISYCLAESQEPKPPMWSSEAIERVAIPVLGPARVAKPHCPCRWLRLPPRVDAKPL